MTAINKVANAPRTAPKQTSKQTQTQPTSARRPGRPVVVPSITTESRHDKFRRLAVSRMNRVLVAMRLLGQLTSDNYKFTAKDAEAIERTLSEAAQITIAKFKRPSAADPGFEFLEEEEGA